MSGVGDMLFGSEPEQVGTAISPGQAFAQQQFMPLLQRQAWAALGGKPLWQTPQAPGAPSAQGYTAQGYNAPQMPFSSPMDFLQQGEMDAARNVMENFYGSGGGGSARGGGSGAGFDREAALSAQLGQGAMGRYMNALLPYSQMQNQASMFGADAQNQASMFGAQGQNQMNLAGYGGQMQQYGYENQAMQAPWNYQNIYSNTTGSPMVQQGQQGLFDSFIGMSPLLLGGAMGWL